VICLYFSTGICIAWIIPAVSCWLHVLLPILDRLKDIQLSHQYSNMVPVGDEKDGKLKVARYWSNSSRTVSWQKRTVRTEVHEPINSVCKEEELSQKKKDSTTVSVCKKSNKADYSNYHLHTKFYPTVFLRLIPYVREIIFNVTEVEQFLFTDAVFNII